MRLLHVLESLDPRYGGPLHAVRDLTEHSQAPDFQCEILGFTASPAGPCPAHVHALELRRSALHQSAPGLDAWLDAHLARFDGVILHGHWLAPYRAIAAACQRASKPYFCFPHGMLDEWAIHGQGALKAAKKLVYWSLFERRLVEGARAVLFTTERESRVAGFDLPGARRVITPYGTVARRGAGPLPALDVPESAKVALYLGRLHEGKNVPFLIEAWGRARPAADWRLVIAGPAAPGYVDELRARAERLGIAHQVSFPGMVGGALKSAWLRRARWFLFASRNDSFGNTVIEAIQHGCPVAVSDQVGAAEFLHAESEVLPLDPGAWVEFLRARMPDEPRRKRIVALDRELVLPRFEPVRLASEWRRTLRGLLEPEPGRAAA